MIKRVKDKKNLERKVLSLFEIILTISLTITAAYFIHESDSAGGLIITTHKVSGLDKIIAGLIVIFGKIVFGEKGLVSAEELVLTCLENKNGSICQEYTSSQCNSQCKSTCIPASRSSVSQCQLGTCYDRSEGTCTTQSPRQACENGNGTWFSDPNANVLECRRGCCLIGDNALFMTEQQCIRQSALLGTIKQFKPEVNTELSCYLLGKVQEEGACVFENKFEKTCKYALRSDCARLHGDFRSGFLCSAPELGANCKPQATVGCVDGKDEIYWFDSCGNKENIYDSNNKVGSFNGGKILSKNQSCSLGTTSNPFAYQGTCGNCFYLTGSRCGVKTATEKLDDSSKNVVCRDLTCKDEKGQRRQNGESWCAYQSSIGVDTGSGGFLRSTDAVGSEHFGKVCKDGEVMTEPCSGYRNQICVESKTHLDNGGSFSSAACVMNDWQNCIKYNTDLKSANNPEGITPEERNNKCSNNSACFIKTVNIADHFQFDSCAPKYPEGSPFNVDNLASKLCGYASQKCKVVYVKKITGWECKANCACESAAFAEQMNDLCISMGDCGAKVNYNGDLTLNYGVTGAPGLSKAYLDGIKKYSDPVPGKVAEPSPFTGSVPGFLDSINSNNADENGGGLDFMNIAFGVGGKVLSMLGAKAISLGVEVSTAALNAAEVGITANVASNLGPALQALGKALHFIGAVVAVAGVIYQIYGFIAEGDYVMAAIVAGVAVVAYLCFGFQIAGLIVMAVVLILQFAFGLGKTKQVIVEFKCKPWQPPLGGANCGECGKKLGLPCTRYACGSLGQTCELINEGTGAEACVNNHPNDVTKPVIRPLDSALSPGYSYAEVVVDGFKVKSNDSSGCLDTYTPITLGINVSKYAYCKVDTKHTDTFEDMFDDFGDSYYQKTHNMTLSMPSLESLGLTGYDPNRQADYNLYIRCKDKNGNTNDKEFDINFCVKPGADITPPIVTSRRPIYQYAAFGATKMNWSVYTNEPSDCRYDSNNVSYKLMTNQMNCNNDLLEQEIYGWRCNAEFDVPQNDSVYYVKCFDQPWLVPSPDGIAPAKIRVDRGQNENGSRIIDEIDVAPNRTRNAMTKSYEYIIKVSKSPLNIDSITPASGSEITSGVEPTSVNIEVKTSGGADGNAECTYKSGDQYVAFFNTLARVHTQVFQTMSAGKKILDVKCTDLAGNVAKGLTTFVVNIDSAAPVVTRVFKQGDVMNLITNENSKCYFITDSSLGCDFNINNASLMSGDKIVHTTDVSEGRIYYIKCADSYGNKPGECTMKVRGVDLK
jgi:hypothetical protein